MQACEHAKVPRTLTPNMRSKRRTGVSSVPVSEIALALLTSTSMPPKASTALLHRGRDGVVVAHVELQRQRAAAGGFHLRGDAVDGSGELRMRLDGLAGHHDVGAVARAA